MFCQADDYRKPLYWLKDASSAQRRCLPVDSTQKRFEDFTATFATPANWAEWGQVVLVTGEKGCGKTSLIQRCAVWLTEERARTGECTCRIITVDLSDERWAGPETVDERMRRTLGRMVTGMGTLLSDSEASVIMGRPAPTDAFHDLSTVLASRRDSAGLPVVLMVLLEGYPAPAELTRYYYAANKGMFFFAEMFQDSEWSSITDNMSQFNRDGANLHPLHLDDVNPGDVQAFADWINGPGDSWIRETWGNRIADGNVPVFPDGLVADVRSNFLDTGTGPFVAMMLGALRVAIEAQAPEVTGTHLAVYFRELAESV